jgi:hypothetical protein
MNITIFQFKEGRLIYGDDNFVYFEPLPRFTINRGRQVLILENGDDEVSIDLNNVMTLLNLKSFDDCLCFFYDNYFAAKSISDASKNQNSIVTELDEIIVQEAFEDFSKKINY